MGNVSEESGGDVSGGIGIDEQDGAAFEATLKIAPKNGNAFVLPAQSMVVTCTTNVGMDSGFLRDGTVEVGMWAAGYCKAPCCG